MLTLDHNYLRRLIESSPDIVIAVDRRGIVIYYNDGARKNLRFAPEEIIGQHVTRLYPSEAEARRVMGAMRQSPDHGRIANFETVLRDKDGQLIPIAISGSLIYDEADCEVGSIGFARDIRQMRRREQLATAGEIAVSLAHEINNPLEAITNNLELLTRSCEAHLSPAEMVTESEHLACIRSGLERVQAIVRRLDEMARRGTYETRDYLQGRKMADLTPREPRGEADRNGKPAARETANGSAARCADWPLAGMVILVLDDDATVLNSLAEILRAERCIVHTAERPSAALGILRNVKIDAVISDVVMPEMDGHDFYMRVKEEMPKLPVILMTAYYYDKDHIIKRSRVEGLTGAIFKKPVNPTKLREMLLQVRRNGEPRPPSRAATVPAPDATVGQSPSTH
ncbi:MAG TPA: response regulator [Candidatus Binataceae bacterium]|nr:response regulator [Candidatus Binataceae bacterium]